jgi:hypothetical protein
MYAKTHNFAKGQEFIGKGLTNTAHEKTRRGARAGRE